jgi:NitT/TauT family transport system ATP-binding protein
MTTVENPLSFDSVSMVFPDGTAAVNDVSLDLGEQEFVTIVGPSGCGKSTLLRIASGLLSPTSGKVTVVDRDNIGFVFQDSTLMPWRTVERNVGLLNEIEGLPAAERKRRIREAISLVNLDGFEQHRPRQLSGGMRMRVSLARALTTHPRLFLFDEPFGALDEISRQRLNDELLSLFVETRFSALFITHSVSEAVYLSTRVLVMGARPGRVVGEVEIPFEYPRTKGLRFTPEFGKLSADVAQYLLGDA